MIGLAISVLWFLIALIVLVGIGWVVIWVLGQLGITIPPMVVKLGMIIIGLLVLIYFLGLVAGGNMGLPGVGYGQHRSSLEFSSDRMAA